MAHKKGEGSVKNGRDSQSKRLGVKKFGGEIVKSGMIIIRQRGTQVQPGRNVGLGRDHTIFAVAPGVVLFERVNKTKLKVSVVPTEAVVAKATKAPKTTKTAAVKAS